MIARFEPASRRRSDAGKAKSLRRRARALLISGVCGLSASGVLAGAMVTTSSSIFVEDRAAVTVVNSSPLLAMVLLSGDMMGPVATLSPSSGYTATSESSGGDRFVSGGGSGAATLNGDAVSVDMGSAQDGSDGGDGVPRIIVQYN